MLVNIDAKPEKTPVIGVFCGCDKPRPCASGADDTVKFSCENCGKSQTYGLEPA